MAMRAWQWCVGVTGNIHLSQSTTWCRVHSRGVRAWVGAGGRKTGGGGGLGVDTGGVVVFAGPEGAGYIERVPYDGRGGLIHFMFGSKVGFSGTADRTALFTIRTNPRWRAATAMLEKIKCRYLRNRSSDPLHVLF